MLHIHCCSEGLRRPLLARISVQQRSQRQGGEQDVQIDIEAGSQEEEGADDNDEQVPAQWLLARFSIRHAAPDPACSQQMAEMASQLALPKHHALELLCLRSDQPALQSHFDHAPVPRLEQHSAAAFQAPAHAHVPRLHLSSCLDENVPDAEPHSRCTHHEFCRAVPCC